MLSKYVLLSVLALLTISSEAFAATRAVTCHGCSDLNMSNAATDVATVGTDTVFVFNQLSKEVRKYRVVTYREDSVPFTIVKEATGLEVDENLADCYEDVVNDTVQNEGREIVLPPDFAIKSSAGAARSPNSAMGYINQHLNELGWVDATKLNLTRLFSNALANAIPLIDIEDLVRNPVVTVQYPDGSTEMYVINYMFNLYNSGIESVVSPVAGTATDQDGQPIPGLKPEFNGRTFEDRNGALSDWVEYAREHDVPTIGALQEGGTMVCYMKGAGHLVCELQMP